MKNFSFKHNDKTLWHSRAVAVAVFVYGYDISNSTYILANKRGKKTPDYQGFWNCPCGYLDFDETLEEAAAREVFEESGVKLRNPEDLEMLYIDSKPDDDKQNVTIIYKALAWKDFDELSNKHSDDGEIADIKWINISQINEYKWAFSHDGIIKKWIK